MLANPAIISYVNSLKTIATEQFYSTFLKMQMKVVVKKLTNNYLNSTCRENIKLCLNAKHQGKNSPFLDCEGNIETN